MDNLGKRLAAARERKQLTQAALAKRVGAGQSTIASLESRNKDASGALLLRIAKVLDVDLRWLIEGGEPLPEPKGVANPDDGSIESKGLTLVAGRPLHAVTISQYDTGGRMGSAGVVLRDQPGVIESWRVSREWLEKNVRGFTAAGKLCIVTGFGDSMRPMFNPGDPLIVDAGVNVVEFDAVYFFRVGEEGFIKRLQRVPGKGLLAISENKAYRDWVIEPSMDFEVFGRVLKVWRSEDF